MSHYTRICYLLKKIELSFLTDFPNHLFMLLILSNIELKITSDHPIINSASTFSIHTQIEIFEAELSTQHKVNLIQNNTHKTDISRVFVSGHNTNKSYGAFSSGNPREWYRGTRLFETQLKLRLWENGLKDIKRGRTFCVQKFNKSGRFLSVSLYILLCVAYWKIVSGCFFFVVIFLDFSFALRAGLN